MMCKKEGSCGCCKCHLAAKGVGMLVLAGVIFCIEKGYLNISYPMLLAIILLVIGLKKLVMAAVWKEQPKKKGKK